MKPSILLLLACVLATAGCATSNKRSDFQETERATMASWMGHSKQELIQAWGPPTKTAPDMQGGEIWIYDKTVTMPGPPGQISPSPFGGIHHLAKKGFDPLMGARPMARLIQETIRKALADELLFGRLAQGGHVIVDVDDEGKVKLEFEEAVAA